MLLISFLFGILIGNYTTTFLFRLPRGIEICGINKNVNTPPHCAQCKNSLKFYEYLPVFSWIFSRFKCNYCGTAINPQYFFLELSTGILSLMLYCFLGFSEKYLLLIALWLLTMLAGMINLNHQLIIKELTQLVIVLGMIYRTSIDQSILPFMTYFGIASIFASATLSYRKWQDIQYRNELIHIVLQASLWLRGLDIVFIICIYHILSKSKYRYLLSLISLSCVTILENIH